MEKEYYIKKIVELLSSRSENYAVFAYSFLSTLVGEKEC